MTANNTRRDEAPRNWFRTERVFREEGGWYFHTREGVNLGPYQSQFDAEIEASMIQELFKEVEQGPQSLQIIRDFVLESYSLGRGLLPTYTEESAATV